MAFCLRPPPLLQEQRSLTVSSDNGTVTPLPIPYTDLWDINSIPNAGLTQIYNISNISQYQGRIIYINKTQDTTGSTIQLELPGGYVFSTVGTSTLVLPDAPSAFGLVFSSSSIISVISGLGGPPGPAPNAYENGILQGTLSPGINFTNLDVNSSPQGVNVTQTINSTPINYQVADANISNNTISRINNSNSSAIVECDNVGNINVTSAGQLFATADEGGIETQGAAGFRITTLNGGQLLLVSDTGASTLYGLTTTEIQSDGTVSLHAFSGDLRVPALSNLNSPDQYITRLLPTGRLYASSIPYSRRATITNLTVPIGTADGVVYGSLIFAGGTPYGRVGDIIEFTYVSFAGFDNVGTETSINIGGHLIPSIGTGINQLKGTVCLTSLSGTTPTYKYTLLYNTNNLVTGTFVGPNISSGLSVYLIAASFPATTSPIVIDFAFMQLNRLNQA